MSREDLPPSDKADALLELMWLFRAKNYLTNPKKNASNYSRVRSAIKALGFYESDVVFLLQRLGCADVNGLPHPWAMARLSPDDPFKADRQYRRITAGEHFIDPEGHVRLKSASSGS
jgi:hypothetical protein